MSLSEKELLNVISLMRVEHTELVSQHLKLLEFVLENLEIDKEKKDSFFTKNCLPYVEKLSKQLELLEKKKDEQK